jgi:hypothetical protein
VASGRFVIEQTPVADGRGDKRGVVAEGPPVKQKKQRTHVDVQPYTTRIRTASGSNRSRDYSLTSSYVGVSDKKGL